MEMTGICPCTDSVALLVKAGGTGLSLAKLRSPVAGRFELKGW